MSSYKTKTLAAMASNAASCRACSLCETRTNVVFGSGDPDSPVMLIGEAPGRNEDLQGVPFVGAAGRQLDEMLSAVGLSHDSVYIANILKCRPPNNRDPLPEEIDACTPHLNLQINIIRPKVIVALGSFASRFCLNEAPTTPMHAMRGRIYDRGGRYVLPVYHPAACIYDRSKLPVLQSDLALMLPYLKGDSS